MKLKLFVAGVLAAASFAASADNQSLNITEGQAAAFTGAGTLFSSLDGSDTISFYGLAAGSYEVVVSYSGTYTKITSASLNGLAPEEIHAGQKSSSGFFDVTTGSPFVLKLFGTVTASPLQKALYNGTITVTAVPEPETYGMMLGGLALLGVVARRKKQS